MAFTEQRGGSMRWQQSQRGSIPASMGQLVGALKRLCAEATRQADQAYIAIQKHSFEPYWTFRAKIDEHAALMAVIRGRVPHLRELRQPGVDRVVAAVDHAEQEILILTVRASLKFCFALSANPWLPVGARETFCHEIDTLKHAREILELVPVEELPQDLLDDIGMAQMILEEIIEKSPSLVDFGGRTAAPVASEPPGEDATAPVADATASRSAA
jgi:hypothetical protein